MKTKKRTVKSFTESEKHKIIQELISTKCTKIEIWRKYTGYKQEHGQILTWMRQLGYVKENENGKSSPTIVSQLNSMGKDAKGKNTDEIESESFETMQLKKRIAELEKQLKDAELKAIAFSTMVDIAEKEFKIPIRKKYNTKP